MRAKQVGNAQAVRIALYFLGGLLIFVGVRPLWRAQAGHKSQSGRLELLGDPKIFVKGPPSSVTKVTFVLRNGHGRAVEPRVISKSCACRSARFDKTRVGAGRNFSLVTELKIPFSGLRTSQSFVIGVSSDTSEDWIRVRAVGQADQSPFVATSGDKFRLDGTDTRLEMDVSYSLGIGRVAAPERDIEVQIGGTTVSNTEIGTNVSSQAWRYAGTVVVDVDPAEFARSPTVQGVVRVGEAIESSPFTVELGGGR